MAVVYRARIVSGFALLVSSVTYMTGMPCPTAKETASSVIFRSLSSVQSSAKNRTDDEPMKVQASMGMPARCEISMMGTMSFRRVRAAQLGRMRTVAQSFVVEAYVATRRRHVWLNQVPVVNQLVIQLSVPPQYK